MPYSSRLELVVDSRTGETRLRNFRTELGRTERAGSSAGDTIGRTSRQIDGMATVTQTATRALAGLAGALSVREVIRYSDAWTSAGNRIRVYTDSVREMQEVQSRLVSTARDTRSSFEATADLYAALARSNDELGLSQDKLIELTSTINKTFALSGVEAQAAAGAIRQLGQGLAAGALRGDEFNSVAEQAPDIMRAIAQSLGMAIGDLREFAATGGITAEIIVNALTEAREEIDGNFSRSITTFGQNLENAQTNLIEFVGTSDTLAGATSALGGTIETLSENLETIADVAVVAGTVFAGRLAGGAAAAGASMVAAQVQALRYQATLASMAGASRVAAAGLGTLATAARGAGAAMAFLGGPVGLAVVAAGSLYYFRDSLSDTATEAEKAEKGVKSLAERMGDLTEAELRHERTGIERKLRETATALATASEEAERLKAAQSDSAAGSMSGIGSVGLLAKMGEANRQVAKLSAEEKKLQGDLVEVEGRLKTLTSTQDANTNSTESAAEAAKKWASAYKGLIQQLDPAQAALNEYFDTLGKIDSLGLGERETDRLSKLALERYEEQMDRIAAKSKEGGEKAGEEFATEFESQWARIAPSLIEQLYEGNWDAAGRMIGGELITGLTADLGRSLTKNFGEAFEEMQKGGGGLDFGAALGGLGSALTSFAASPFAGPVAGVIGQGITDKLTDYFSDDWDPTALRQATQGTGTVLGSIDEKSQSIAKGMDITAGATEQLVGINRSMLQALQRVQLGIEGASARVARGAGDAIGGIPMPSVMTGGEFLSGGLGGGFEFAADAYLDYLSFMFTGGLVDIGKYLGGKSKKRDEGIRIIGGHITDLIDSTLVQAYATFRVKKHAFDDYDTKERYKNLNGDVSRQFSLVFESIYDSVGAGLDVFGLNIDRLASGFKVSTQKLSLEGLNADQQQAELEAYFGTVFDNLAEHTVPWLTEFQKAGEGLGETLARVATQTQTTQYAIDSLGIRFDDLAGRELVAASERLVELGGGLDNFISSMQGFIQNFATEAQQFELAQRNLNKAMAEANLTLPDTRQGFYDLMQAQNGSTEQGAENIATLLRLQGVADQYYSGLEEQTKSVAEMQREALSAQRSLIQSSLSLAQRAADSIAGALSGLQVGTPEASRMRRESALSSLSSMASRGRVTAGDQLSNALSAATNIDANNYASLNDYIREVARTGAVLTDVKAVADKQVSAEQRALNAIEATLKAMQEESKMMQSGIAKNTAKTAKILERMEIDGVTV